MAGLGGRREGGALGDRALRPNLKEQLRTLSPRHGGVIVEGATGSWSDLYHTAMVVGWPTFLGAIAALFLVVNFVFAALFALQSECVANVRPGDVADLFFFSVETFSTTGYGDMHPLTFYGHSVATLETFVSLIATAGVTGLIFARFSRPRARLLFAGNPIVAAHDGVETLMVRVANARNSFLSEATAKLWWLGPIVTAEGKRYVGFLPLRLLRNENPALSLSWTLFHPIDSSSPLYGKSAEKLVEDQVNIVLNIRGVDETSSQEVHSRHAYVADDLRWGHEFVDMFHMDDDGRRHVDLSKIHDTRLR
jgi:inward rectifier potassium channel